MQYSFNSKVAQVVLWSLLSLVLMMDFLGLWMLLSNWVAATGVMKVMVIFGVAIRIGILLCLFARKGPVKVLIYVWGGMFLISGFAGIISFIYASSSVPVGAYIEKTLFLILGILLIYIAKKQISCIEVDEI